MVISTATAAGENSRTKLYKSCEKIDDQLTQIMVQLRKNVFKPKSIFATDLKDNHLKVRLFVSENVMEKKKRRNKTIENYPLTLYTSKTNRKIISENPVKKKKYSLTPKTFLWQSEALKCTHGSKIISIKLCASMI